MEKTESFAKNIKFLDIMQCPRILYDKMGELHQKLKKKKKVLYSARNDVLWELRPEEH